MTTTFIGILDGSGTAWGVRIPDLVGAYGGGGTPEEAVESAVEAARILAADCEARGKPLPLPRALDEIRPMIEDGERPVMIPLVE